MQIHITRRWMSHCVDVKLIDLEKWKMATDALLNIVILHESSVVGEKVYNENLKKMLTCNCIIQFTF
jgi:hypothetical protein